MEYLKKFNEGLEDQDTKLVPIGNAEIISTKDKLEKLKENTEDMLNLIDEKIATGNLRAMDLREFIRGIDFLNKNMERVINGMQPIQLR